MANLMSEENPLAPLGPSAPTSRNAQNPRAPLVRNLELDEVDAFGQLRSVWDLLVKNQWLILAVAVFLTALVAFYSFKMQPVYQAVARIDVEAELPLLQ